LVGSKVNVDLYSVTTSNAIRNGTC